MSDPSSQLRSATRRAKSDVANKLVSMFLHELSRRIGQSWAIKVDGEEYENLVRRQFGNRCPYCCCDLAGTSSVIEHLDGMNRYRAGLHLPGNVVVACRRCNGEKRRDDSIRRLHLAATGWESFLSHDGKRCDRNCATCRHWEHVWPAGTDRETQLRENLEKIRSFRNQFTEFERVLPVVSATLPALLTSLYSDCQVFAEREIKSLLERFQLGFVSPSESETKPEPSSF